jgi:hypothetical protein
MEKSRNKNNGKRIKMMYFVAAHFFIVLEWILDHKKPEKHMLSQTQSPDGKM